MGIATKAALIYCAVSVHKEKKANKAMKAELARQRDFDQDGNVIMEDRCDERCLTQPYTTSAGKH